MSDSAAIARIERQLKELAKPKPYYVTATVIKQKTGWDDNKMKAQRAINKNWWKITDDGGYAYDFNSIPKELLIDKQKETA